MELSDFFAEHPRVALAFSGGADSAYLLYEALKCCNSVGVYYIKSAFQPEFELEDAKRLAHELGAEMKVSELDILSSPDIQLNPQNRCYFCKQRIMSTIIARAKEDGFDTVIDGTNASDDISDRPGYKALRELGVLSPLRDCGITKAELRCRSEKAGLFTWNKPAYACLATRIPTGEEITAQKLKAIERGEEELFKLGFTDFRIRTSNGRARLQFTAEQQELAEKSMDEIRKQLSVYFDNIEIDPMGRKKSN